jgi:endonuclease/exonuclease/phosphatase family metal-dependent hydrolase
MRWSPVLRIVGALYSSFVFVFAHETLAAPFAATTGTGVLRVVTYNVAGLPEGISQSHPLKNLPQIGALLNRYDLVLIQEDFAYPDLLRQKLALPFGSPPFQRGERLDFGDGLSQFGKFPLTPPQRNAWRACNGVLDSYHDCLTPKGLSWSRATLEPGIELDVYNVHLDAGGAAADRAARASQLQQLTQAIQQLSGDRAFLLGGDFNLTRSERPLLASIEQALGALDVCTALRCRDPWRIDRILVRSSARLRLEPRSWKTDARFIDARGRNLSDHLAVGVEIGWTAVSTDDRVAR